VRYALGWVLFLEVVEDFGILPNPLLFGRVVLGCVVQLSRHQLLAHAFHPASERSEEPANHRAGASLPDGQAPN
jgi:hypothetical protein